MNMDAIAWGAAATVVVFAASQIINFVSKLIIRSEEHKNIKKSLEAEIDCILGSGGEARNYEVFAEFIQANTIENINAYSFVAIEPLVYKSVLNDVSRLERDVIFHLSKFYTLVARVNGFIIHFKSAEFTNSDEGIQNIMKNILIQTVEEMHREGRTLLERLRER